jgi:hypothetical protein
MVERLSTTAGMAVGVYLCLGVAVRLAPEAARNARELASEAARSVRESLGRLRPGRRRPAGIEAPVRGG